MSHQATSSATNPGRQSIADIVLNPEPYSTLVVDAKPGRAGTAEPSFQPQEAKESHVLPHRHPTTSITDLVLDNITYDRILSSSAKGLSLDPEQCQSSTPPLNDDLRAPPNSPTNIQSPHSLMSTSFNIMTPETVTRSEMDKTDF